MANDLGVGGHRRRQAVLERLGRDRVAHRWQSLAPLVAAATGRAPECMYVTEWQDSDGTEGTLSRR